MQQKYGDRGLVIVTVNIEEAEDQENRAKVRNFLKNNRVTLINLAPASGEDLSRWADTWGITGVPLNLIYDRQGKLAKRIAGAELEEMDQQLEQLLQEK